MCCCVLLCVVVCCGVLLCVSEENRRKNEGERAGKKQKVESGKSDAAIFFLKI